jgi:hypothetical protein
MAFGDYRLRRQSAACDQHAPPFSIRLTNANITTLEFDAVVSDPI